MLSPPACAGRHNLGPAAIALEISGIPPHISTARPRRPRLSHLTSLAAVQHARNVRNVRNVLPHVDRTPLTPHTRPCVRILFVADVRSPGSTLSVPCTPEHGHSASPTLPLLSLNTHGHILSSLRHPRPLSTPNPAARPSAEVGARPLTLHHDPAAQSIQ